jgi:PAS domain S-box-containing protein
MTPEESQRVREILRGKFARKERVLGLEGRHIHRDGRVVWVELNAMPIFDSEGVFKGYRGIMQDITGRKQAEASLRESEEKFRTLAETAAVAILVYQGEHYVYANPSAEKISGFSREELLGMKFWDIMHPDDREMVRERGMARQQGATVLPRYEVRYRTKDGRDGVLEINASTINFNGQPAGLITALDITDLKRSETAMKEAKAQAELYLDLMGHDINNMHQVALGYLELTAELQEDENMRELLERPRDVLLRSARLIDNVRKLQKLREGLYLNKPVEIVGILAGVLTEYDAVPGKSLALYTHDIDRGFVEANELLYDVFANLVSNAIKHSGSHARVTINLELVQECCGNCYRVSVEDNGPGVPDTFKLKVFNRLLRGDAGAKGMGLGLYIVKTLVDSFQGRVWVEDRVPGDHRKGAKFVVLLPALYK